jgi:hypothetical protein
MHCTPGSCSENFASLMIARESSFESVVEAIPVDQPGEVKKRMIGIPLRIKPRLKKLKLRQLSRRGIFRFHDDTNLQGFEQNTPVCEYQCCKL